MNYKYFTLIYLFALLISCKQNNSSINTPLAAHIMPIDSALLPCIQAELALINQTLQNDIPIRKLDELSLNTEQKKAQKIALADTKLLANITEPNLKQPTRNEIFSITPLRESDITPQIQLKCPNNECYRVEMFNYAINLLTSAVVNIKTEQVVNVNNLLNIQPDIPERLKKLAIEIATQSPEVQKALGYAPNSSEALMASTKTALNKSRCERSKHLCVAPTFISGEKALWAIVDLTDLKLVGIRWTNVGNAGALPTEIITERKLQNGNITECYCKTETKLEKNNWSLNYMLTNSDGLRISDLTFNGEKIIESAKLVDWHVNYSNTDGFGYSDAVGCPYFSTAAVIAIEAPKILPIIENKDSLGFVLQQNFYSEGWPLPCNYNYCQRFEFYNDGKFRISCASLGRGCGNDGTYRPVIRIAFASTKSNFYQFENNTWKPWNKEQYNQQNPTTTYSPEGYLYKIETANNKGFYIEPGKGQFNDAGRGDNAWTYITRTNKQKDEGDSDLATIGPCCNTNYQQGPEKFIEPTPEPISNSQLTLWYVSTLKNDNTPNHEYCWAENLIVNGVYTAKTYPCFAGPMFIPIK